MPHDSSIQNVPAKLASKDPTRTRKPETIRWRTPAQERIYGQRLLQALKSARRSPSRPLAPSRAVKEAADSALALAAKGQTRWSRAILSTGWRKRKILLLKARGKMIRRTRTRTRTWIGKPGSDSVSGKVRDRLRVLSRLVPGGRKLSAPTLLEEAADYLAALEMQVKAMRTLADLLSSAAPLSSDAAGR